MLMRLDLVPTTEVGAGAMATGEVAVVVVVEEIEDIESLGISCMLSGYNNKLECRIGAPILARLVFP